MQIRKTFHYTGNDEASEPVVTSTDSDTNAQVIELFNLKPTLRSITFQYEGDDEFVSKLYERVPEAVEEDDTDED